MCHSIFVGYINGRGGAGLGLQQGIDLTGILIKEKQLFVVSARRPKQFEAIRFWLGQGLFVAEDDLRRVILYAPEGDKSSALAGPACGALKVCE